MITSKGASARDRQRIYCFSSDLVDGARYSGSRFGSLGIDRFMSTGRALTNLIGNGVATIVVSEWEKDLNKRKLDEVLTSKTGFSEASANNEI